MRKKRLNLFGLDGSLYVGKSRVWRDETIEDDRDFSLRVNFSRFHLFHIGIFIVTLVFLGRLFGLTVINGAENKSLAENNRVRLVEQEAQRGRILDRYGKVIAESSVLYFLKKDDKEVEISKQVADELERQGKASENFEGEAGRVIYEVKRKYPLGEAASHVLGYTSVLQKEEAKDDEVRTNSVGRLGIEATYDNFLVGTVGKKLVEVDAEGKKVSILGSEENIRGRDLTTSLDSELQKIAFESLKKHSQDAGSKKGAVVIQKVDTGEVLALVSAPSFDAEDIGKSTRDKDNPFFNRAVQGSFPPGSVFKIATALGGLDSGKITRDTEFEDVGQFELGGERFSNWFFNQYGKTDGVLKIERALTRSNDTYFYRLAEKVGLEDMRKGAIKLRFGQKTGVDLPDEAYGLVPDGVWKESAVGDMWYLGDTLHLSIGQGYMLVSPIQVNVMTTYVASGKLTKPYIVTKIDGGNLGKEIKFEPKVEGENLFSGDNLEIIKNGMKGACQAGGTGAPFFKAEYKVACKTGTAEDAGGKPHAWFTVFGPFDDPEIAMTVVVERGGEGSAVAAPVAKEIFDWWMGNRAGAR